MLEDLNRFSGKSKQILYDVLKTYISDKKVNLNTSLFFNKHTISAKRFKREPSIKTQIIKKAITKVNIPDVARFHARFQNSSDKIVHKPFDFSKLSKKIIYSNNTAPSKLPKSPKPPKPKGLDESINDILEIVKKERKLNINMRSPQLICLNPHKKSDDVIVFFPGLFSYTRDENILIKYINPFKEHIRNTNLFICDWDAGNKNLIKMSERIKGERLNSTISKMKSIIIKIILRIIPYSTKIYKFWKDTCFIADLSGMIISREIWDILTSGKKITIIGHSLGCKVIYRALEFIMQNSPNNKNIKFEKIILLGGAEKIDRNWDYVISLSKSVVNLYSQKDKVLKHVYKKAENGIMPIGLSFIKSKKSHLLNKDCSDFIKSHNGYFKESNMRMILERNSPNEDFIPI